MTSEGEQHQPQRSRTRHPHNKALQIKDSASRPICTNVIILEEDIHSSYNDDDDTFEKPNHYTL